MLTASEHQSQRAILEATLTQRQAAYDYAALSNAPDLEALRSDMARITQQLTDLDASRRATAREETRLAIEREVAARTDSLAELQRFSEAAERIAMELSVALISAGSLLADLRTVRDNLTRTTYSLLDAQHRASYSWPRLLEQAEIEKALRLSGFLPALAGGIAEELDIPDVVCSRVNDLVKRATESVVRHAA